MENTNKDQKGFASALRAKLGIARNFGRELWKEHEFWVNTLAVKGGASAVIVAGAVGVSFVIGLPFIAAAAGIAACGGLIGVGVWGIGAGTRRAYRQLRDVYAKARGKPLPERPVKLPRKPLVERLKERPGFKKFLETAPVQKFLSSPAWKLTKKMIPQRDTVLGGLAVGGSVLSLAIGATALVTQIIVLPVVAVGSLLTFATVAAASYTVSGVSGLFFSVVGLKHQHKRKRAEAAAREVTKAQASATPAPTAPEAASPAAPPAAADFNGTASPPAPKASEEKTPNPPAKGPAP